MATIAIDAGTSVIKAVAFSDDGREIGVARAGTRVLRPQPDFSEQSMEAVWEATRATVREVLGRIDEPVTSICTTAQGDGCWLVDGDGAPTGNALLWNDGRGTKLVERWRADGAIDRSRKVSGSVTYPGLSNALLAWLDEQEGERLGRSRTVLSCNGWLFFRLTGRLAADMSDASNPFGDVRARTYAEESFRGYGLERYRAMFPAIASGTSLQAGLSARAAADLNLPDTTAVVMAPYDIVATAYGAGAVEVGQACLILGTTICAETITADLKDDAEGDGTTIALDEGMYLRAMPTLAGCETLEWTARILHVGGLDALAELAQGASAGAGDLIFLPYLSEAGERSPFLEPQASGSWQNLKLTHGREEMARAVYEGLSFVIRECLEAAAGGETREVRVCGGGARSDFWCQMIADVTGVRVLRPAECEIGARGAYLFSRVILGSVPSLRDAVRAMPSRFDTFAPDEAMGGVYERAYREFLRTREAMRPRWKSRGETAAEGGRG